MANQRVLVMNGQRLLQSAGDDGKWKVDKVTPAADGMKPGIYNIGNATAPTKGKAMEGMVIHADQESVYQQTGKSTFVKHDAKAFEKPPAVGSTVAVNYDGNKATATASQGQSRSRSI